MVERAFARPPQFYRHQPASPRRMRFRAAIRQDRSGSAANQPLAEIRWAVHFRPMMPPDKSERMEMRRAVGNRSVPSPTVAPYHRGPDYLIAHACFDCRKSWKRPGEQEHVCPDCGQGLALMGRTFRAPARRQIDQWKKVKRLWDAGFRFWSYRSFPEAERYPDDLRDIDAFIERNRTHPMRVKA